MVKESSRRVTSALVLCACYAAVATCAVVAASSVKPHLRHGHGSSPAYEGWGSDLLKCGHPCDSFEDCTTSLCNLCAGDSRCHSAGGICGIRCFSDSDCGGYCQQCGVNGRCEPTNNNGTCLVECSDDSECGGDCPVCSGDAVCHGSANICLAECADNSDCMDPCPICSGDAVCHGPSNICEAECSVDTDCTTPCPICSGDAQCHGKGNICGVECADDSDCGFECAICGGNAQCV